MTIGVIKGDTRSLDSSSCSAGVYEGEYSLFGAWGVY